MSSGRLVSEACTERPLEEKRDGGQCTLAGLTMLVVWLQVPSLEKVLEFKAHEGEIEDLAVGPEGKVRR